jgi:serine/threonine protein phosphatase 1
LDLLNSLLETIEQDIVSQPLGQAFVVFLGDLIDRGPDSAGVVERLRTYAPPLSTRTIFLCGNHEEVFLRVMGGESGLLERWIKFGGKQCLESYGVDVDRLSVMDEAEALSSLIDRIPKSHIDFITSFADTFRFGDYLCVHAGIHPDLLLEDQRCSDLRWIREPFLNDNGDYGFVVVHGHTIVDEIEQRPNRIGIDTGAYRSGVLTALVIDGSDRRFLTSNRLDFAA